MGFEVAYDPGQNIKIVQAVQKHPVIYNTKMYPPVVYRGVAESAWAEVAAELGVSEGYCKGRWTNIKGCFKRYLRNKADCKSTKSYYLADYLKFMLPYMKDARKPSNVDDANTGDNEIVQMDEEVSNEFEVKVVDSDGEESFYISTASNHSEEVNSQSDKERNADWDFFSSLLPDVQRMDAGQKSKFRNALLSAIDTALYGEDL